MKRKISIKDINRDISIELFFPKVSERYSSWHASKRILSLSRTPQHINKEKSLDINRFNNSLLSRPKKITIERVGTKNPLSLIKLDTLQQLIKPDENTVALNRTRINNIADSNIFPFQRFNQKLQNKSFSSQHTIQVPENMFQQEKQKPIFTIKLLKAFLKNYQAPKKLDFSKFSKRSETEPISQSTQKGQFNNFSFRFKDINEMELKANKITLKHSISINNQSSNSAHFKTYNTQIKRQNRIVKVVKQIPKIKINTKFQEEFNYQSLQPIDHTHKKFSQDISEDLSKISDSLTCYNNRRFNPEPSISAWN